MIDLPSSLRFLPTYPQLIVPVSQTKYGNRAISTVEYADPYRIVDMETVPMKASEAVQLQAFIASARGGMQTIVYRPRHICIPRAYWGDANKGLCGVLQPGQQDIVRKKPGPAFRAPI